MATAAPDPLFDRDALRRRRARAVAQGAADFLIDATAAELVSRLSLVKRRFAAVADLGTASDALRRALAATGQVAKVEAVDLLAAAEDAPLPLGAGSLDLAVSALALQFVDDLPGLLVQVRRALRPDGLFLAAMIGGETLTELRQSFLLAEAETTGGASPRVAPFADVGTAGALLQRADLALPVVDLDRRIVRYSDPLALMADLRRMGATNPLRARRRTPLSRNTLRRAIELYAARFADPDGRVRATFDIVWMSGWAPHQSQPQPLPPGSAKVRLADALGAVERPAKDDDRRG